ncbi:type II toxin-antitoxin system RelE/ParE family toxin [Nocardia sp. NPDC052278]|uniref:type II toxin-antitoxin system RelE family toxin n=1 Tax=unclassified Nocardia TaxID=2637762 RepID=UPI0036C068A4
MDRPRRPTSTRSRTGSHIAARRSPHTAYPHDSVCGATDAIRLLQELAQLGDDPYAPNNAVRPMAGEYAGFYRLRCGDYRAVYRIENNRLVILVIAGGGRDIIYR